MTVNILKNDSLMKAWKKGYNDSDEGLWNTAKGIVSANWQYVCNHPYKTTATFVVIAAVASLTAAYFLNPAYAVFVNTTAESAHAGMIEGSKGLYALAVTNPVFTGLLAAAIVGTIVALAYMNYSKASQIDKVKQKVLKAYGNNEGEIETQRAGDKKRLEEVDGVNPLRILYRIAVTLGLPEQQER